MTLRFAAAVLGVALLFADPGRAAAPDAPAMTMPPMAMPPMAIGEAATPPPGAMPTEPGQAAFGALHEIVRMLEADPHTDWSKVDLDALRAHLIDMARVTLDAEARVRHIPGGNRIVVTGTGRTLIAIRRLLPEEAMHLNGMHGWRITARPIAGGVALSVTTADPKQVAMIRGLGFAGILASGDFHPRHHWQIARGEPMH